MRIFFASCAALVLSSCTMSLPDALDGGLHRDMTARADDLSVADLAGSGCTQVATWPAMFAAAGFDPTQGDTFTLAAQQSAEPQNILALEDWHTNAAETYPKMITFKSSDTYAQCDVCARLLESCTAAAGCTRGYFAQSGTMTVTHADTNAAAGRMTVSGANVKLVEWQFPQADADGGVSGDVAVPGGRCWEIASVALDVPWGGAVDGGTGGPDGGAGACHPVVNELMTGTSASASDEFVEIFNPCQAAVNVSGWKLVYRSSNNNNGGKDTTIATFAAGTTIAAGGYLVGVDKAVTTRAHDFTYTGGLAGTGGAVGLRDLNSLIDSVSYQTLAVANNLTEGTPAANPPADSSLARHPNGADNNMNSTDFQVTATITPGAANP